MSDELLLEAIAARAAGEDFPGGDAARLAEQLRGSAEARAELAELERAIALMRSETAAPSAARRARVDEATSRSRGRRGLLTSAALFLAAALLLAFVIEVRHRRLTGVPIAAPGNEQPVRGHGSKPGGEIPKPPGKTEIEDLFAAADKDPNGVEFAPGGLKRNEDDGGLGGGGTMGAGTPSDANLLHPFSAQISFGLQRPGVLPGEFDLAETKLLRAGDGRPADTAWLEYRGNAGSIVFVECAASDAARAWLAALPLPAGWRRSIREIEGTLVMAASRCCSAEAVGRMASETVKVR